MLKLVLIYVLNFLLKINKGKKDESLDYIICLNFQFAILLLVEFSLKSSLTENQLRQNF